jgi:hypothetical protein
LDEQNIRDIQIFFETLEGLTQIGAESPKTFRDSTCFFEYSPPSSADDIVAATSHALFEGVSLHSRKENGCHFVPFEPRNTNSRLSDEFEGIII